MASYDDINTVANDAGFQGRCLYALTVAASNVLTESTATPNHQARVDYARKIIAGQAISGALLARALLTISSLNSTLSAATTPDFGMTDTQVQTAATNAFNALAGVST